MDCGRAVWHCKIRIEWPSSLQDDMTFAQEDLSRRNSLSLGGVATTLHVCIDVLWVQATDRAIIRSGIDVLCLNSRKMPPALRR